VFFDKGEAALGLRVLSNLAEMNLENRHLLRVLGTRLMQAKQPALALPVFARVLRLAPNEPQSHRDLGLAQAQAGNPQAAIEALYKVVVGKWDGRFADVDMTALAELNAIVATSSKTLDVRFIDPRLLGNLPLDLRVVLSWDADNTDVDLHVLDPNKEEAFYGRQLTYQGGRMSRDFTGGYGPEEFALRQAKPGIYRVTVKLYGSRAQTVTSGVTAQLTLSRGFGTKAQQDEVVTVRLEATKESTLIGEFEVK
jgi:Ca-activated chloride channel homolog